MIRRSDRWVGGVFLLLLAVAGLVRPVWRSIDPHLEMGEGFFLRGELEDPWGRVFIRQLDGRWRSAGPNSVDEMGKGDDLLLPSWVHVEVCDKLPYLFITLGIALLYCWVLLRVKRAMFARPVARRLGPELARCGALAILACAPFVLAGVGTLELIRQESPSSYAMLEEPLVVPPFVAAVGLGYAITLGLMLRERLSPSAALPADEGAGEQVSGA